MTNKLFLITALLFSNTLAFADYKTVTSLPTYNSQSIAERSAKSNDADDGAYESSTQLRIVKFSDSVKVTAAKTTLLLLVGGSMAGSSKEDIKGSLIEDITDKEKLKNPLFDIEPAIKNYKDTILKDHPYIKDKYLLGFFVKPTRPYWSLIYEKSDKSVKNGYALFFGARHVNLSSKSCVYQSKSYSLEQWKANDYQLVAEERVKIVEECSSQFKRSMDELAKKSIDKYKEDQRFENSLKKANLEAKDDKESDE